MSLSRDQERVACDDPASTHGCTGAEVTPQTTRERLARAFRAFTTRRVPGEALVGLLAGEARPSAGDLVLASIRRVGQHTRLQLPTGRRASLFPGQEVLVAYGSRYAPNQFESYVPDSLEPCHLAAGGGMASRVVTRHRSIKDPTEIIPIGLVVDGAGQRVNLADFALPPAGAWRPVPAFAVVGTSMDAGKTTTAAALVRGLRRAGLRVGAAKVTGTGAGGDYWLLNDSGASPVWDFVDAGHVSTFQLDDAQLEHVFEQLTAHLSRAEVDVAVLEVADGLLQEETQRLLNSRPFRDRVSAVVLAAHDAMGAGAGAHWLRSRDLPLVAISGRVTSSPLAAREAARFSGATLYRPNELGEAASAAELLPTERPAS